MAYTPVELRHVKVRRRLLGYDREVVERLLDEVADSFEAVWRDRGELADRVEDLAKELEGLRAREQLLSQALVAAEHAAGETRDGAKREAELILTEAHQEARAVARNAQADRDRLIAEARRAEGFLRAALGLISEATAESAPAPLPAEPPRALEPAYEPPPAAEPAPEPEQAPVTWPHQETVDEVLGLDDEPPQPTYLRRVVGGESREFDWGD